MAESKKDEALKHSEGGTTTRDDATDLGVPMLQGDASEPQGPEDALGPGPKRGDYSGRVGESNYDPHEVVPNPDAKEGDPNVEVVEQAPRAEDQGNPSKAKSQKGGVTTEES